MNKIPEGLSAQQQKKREETVRNVRKAINDIVAEGAELNIKRVSEYSGLSRSVFSKPHVKTVLTEYGVGEKKTVCDKKVSSVKECSAQKEVNEKNSVIKRLREELERKTLECELLRGKFHALVQKCRINGVEIDDWMK